MAGAGRFLSGVVLFGWSPSPMWRNIGRAVIGLGLIIVALGMIVAASQPLRGDWLVPLVLQRLDGAPLLRSSSVRF